MTATRKWSALAVLLVAAIFVASWFLLIAPKRSDAARLRADKVEQDVTNQRLIEKLEVLKAQAQDLPKQEAFLAQIRRQVPNNPALPALIRDLTAGAKKSGVDILSLAPAVPVAVVAPAATAVVPTTAGTAAPSSGSTTAPGAVSAPPVAVPVLYMVPITVKTTGSYFETEQFLNKVEALKRSFLVTGFTLKYAASTAENTSAGPLELEIKGRVFLSPAAAVAAGATVPVPGASATPAPSTAPAAN
jgi:type IV pilus assembly protein PilO